MSEWLEATREVYAAGGELMPSKAGQSHYAYHLARKYGFLEPVARGGVLKPARITQRGIDLIEGRLAMRIPFIPVGTRIGGRAPGTRLRPVATWLAALPRTNEIRL